MSSTHACSYYLHKHCQNNIQDYNSKPEIVNQIKRKGTETIESYPMSFTTDRQESKFHQYFMSILKWFSPKFNNHE